MKRRHTSEAQYLNFVEDMGYWENNTTRFNRRATHIGICRTLLLFLYLSACSNPTPATHPTDTPKTILHSDTPAKTPTMSAKPPATETYEDPEPGPEEILAHYMKSCRDTVKVDTTVPVSGQPWHITLRHYSTGDSAIQLPERYIEGYKLKKFTTSNFESKLKVTVRDVTLFDTVISKNIFRDSAFESLAA